MYIVWHRDHLRCNQFHMKDEEKYIVITGRRIGTFVKENEIVDRVENMMDDAQLKEHYPEYFI